MKVNYIAIWINRATFALAIVFTTSCSTYSPVSQSSYRYLYDYDSSPLHPGYVVYHLDDTLTQIFFRVHTSELLYTRTAADQPFRAQLKLSWTKDGSFADSLLFEDTRSSDGERWLSGNFNLNVPSGQAMQLEVSMLDVKRLSEQSIILTVDKKDNYVSQNFLLKDASTGAILFNNFSAEGRELQIISDRNMSGDIKVLHDPTQTKLPPPPFSSVIPELPRVEEMTLFPMRIDSANNGHPIFNTLKGRYVICIGNDRRNGKTITVADKFYPEVASVNQLIYPLRYVTSKVEYESIESHSDPKKLIDNFWIECSGSKERARELIRVYYNRVKEANYYFSSYTEGWRTDRGMVHLIFGHPNSIRRTDDSETWIYGEEGNISSVSFVFRRVNYGFSGNVYTLVRDPMFRSHWERMVTTWRNGRVYNE